MSSHLNDIQNWPERAQQAKWSVSGLAKQCGVSKRSLERYFCIQMGKNPKEWLVEQRQQKANKLLRDGSAVKEVSAQLGYKHASNFSRDFKQYWGICPSRKQVP